MESPPKSLRPNAGTGSPPRAKAVAAQRKRSRKGGKVAETRGTVARVLEVIQCLADGPADWSISDLAATLSLPPSTVHRLLSLLQSKEFIASDRSTHRYQAGPELYRVSAILSSRIPIVQIATPILSEVVEQCDETALVAVYLPRSQQMTYVAKAESKKPMRYVIELNEVHSILWGATGRAIMSFLDSASVRDIVARAEPSPAGAPIPSMRKLQAQLAEFRRQGYAITRGLRIPTAVGVAAPFFGADGAVAGTLMLTIPDTRFDARSGRRLANLLLQGAQRVSQALGYRSRP